jgi:hypothetical protein
VPTELFGELAAENMALIIRKNVRKAGRRARTYLPSRVNWSSGGSGDRADGWIRWTTIGCVALLALTAGTVSYLYMHILVALHGQPGWVAALTPLSVDG